MAPENAMIHQVRALFFSRGRGHGHAIPDIAIQSELATIAPNISLTFVSYATGALTFRDHAVDVIDIDLPEDNVYLETLFKAKSVIEKHQPDVIIAHEEFAAIVAAHLSGKPSIFISPWLPHGGTIFAESLTYATAIIIIEDPGLFALPPLIPVPIYTGPIYRKMAFGLDDRSKIREHLGVEGDSPLILVVPGGGSGEAEAPVADLILSAFFELSAPAKRLIFVTKRDFELVSLKTQGMTGVEVISYANPLERLIVASDVILTKATHGITLEAEACGVPTIALSYGLNPVDDVLTSRVPSNIHLYAHAVTPKILADYIAGITNIPFSTRPRPAKRAIYSKSGSVAQTLKAVVLRIGSREMDAKLIADSPVHAATSDATISVAN